MERAPGGYLRPVIRQPCQWQPAQRTPGAGVAGRLRRTRDTADGGPYAAEAPRAGCRQAARRHGCRARPAAPARQAGSPRPDADGRRTGGNVARGLSVRRAARPGRVCRGQALPADRAAQAAAIGQGVTAAAGDRVRGARRGRQGRDDQVLHREPQLPRGAGRRPGFTHRARAQRLVFPPLHPAPARPRRDRALRSVLVQPRRGRAGHGLLHAAGARGFSPGSTGL
jgi:hypothetical protein